MSDEFSVPLLESAPEKCVFTNHVTRMSEVNSIMHANRIPCLKVSSLFTVPRLSKCQGHLSITYSRVALLLQNRLRNLLSLGMQDAGRGQLWLIQNCARNFLHFWTVSICSRDCVWNFLSVSDWNHTNTLINTILNESSTMESCI